MAKKKFYKRWWFIVLVIIMLAIVALIVYSAVTEKKTPVQVGKITRGELQQIVSASGNVNPAVKVEISANIAGEITRLHIREGERVEKGQILVELDNYRYAANKDQSLAGLRAAEANSRLAKAQYEMQQRTFKRTQELRKKSLVSEEAVETAQTQLKVAKASQDAAIDAVRQARAVLRLSRDELKKTIIRSPMDGVVTDLRKEEGEIAIGSTFTRDVIMVVSDPSRIVATVEVDEADIIEVGLGDRATVEIDALPDQKFDGEVIEIAGSAKVNSLGTQEESVSFEVKVLLSGDTSLVRPGMSATADIVTETREAVLQVPIQCVTMRDPAIIEQMTQDESAEKKPMPVIGQGDFTKLKELLFAVENDRATPIWVTTGISSDTNIEIEGEGVAEDMTIICGSFKTLNREIKPNDLVVVAPGAEKTE